MRQHKTIYTAIALALAATLAAAPGFARDEPLRVVTTTTDLAYIAKQIGGDRVTTQALLSGAQDPHFASARPDFILAVNRADVFVEVGLELEIGWSPLLRQTSRNAKILGGGPGYVDASLGIRVLGRPEGLVSRAMGDVHPLGNPHYWTDPLNAAIAGRNIRDALIRVNPAGRRIYDANYKSFHERMKQLTIREKRKFAPYRGMRVAVYHREFQYLAKRFGFEVITSIEEIPGVPPSASRLKEMVDLLQIEEVDIILTAPYNPQSYSETVAEKVGGVVVNMPLSVASEEGIDTYEKTIEVMLERLRRAQDERKARAN